MILIALGEGDKPVETTKEVRAAAHVPLLIICDMLPERTIIESLLSGADIVLSRPISPYLVSAQLTSMLRRANMVPT